MKIYILVWKDEVLKKSVAYSSQGNHTGPLDFSNWLADGSTQENVISITLRQG